MDLAKIKKLVGDIGDVKVKDLIEMINGTLEKVKDVPKEAGDNLVQAIKMKRDKGQKGKGVKKRDQKLLLKEAELSLSLNLMLVTVNVVALRLKGVVEVVEELGWPLRGTETRGGGGGDKGKEKVEIGELVRRIVDLIQVFEGHMGFLRAARNILQLGQELGKAEMNKEEKDKK